ncbi:MAG TPA: BON domain-containing protein [Anaerolineales bacterium]|nr:BON domain-containing protein [Anaerolineales bacterium]
MDSPVTTLVDMRPDMDIEADVRQAIYALDPVNSIDADVSVMHGQVTLTGYMLSEMLVPAIEQAARKVTGARSVVNHLVDDSSLVRRVATALALDPRSRAIPPGYRVVSSLGHAMVVGNFAREAAARGAVTTVCQGVPGVRSVKIKSIHD